MSQIEKQKTTLTCQGCKREIETTYYDICTRREVKCLKCGSKYKFNSSASSSLRMPLRELERSQEKLQKTLLKVIETADLEIKKKS